jgi:hypothetical protein
METHVHVKNFLFLWCSKLALTIVPGFDILFSFENSVNEILYVKSVKIC